MDLSSFVILQKKFCTRNVEILCVCLCVFVCVCLVVCVKVLKEELKFVDFSHKISEIATILKKTQKALFYGH